MASPMVDPIRNIEDNREVCNALDEAWERWIREQDWESVIENHLCPYVEELLLVGDENGETPAQVLVNIALELWTVYGQSEDLRNRIEVTLHDIGIYVLEQAMTSLKPSYAKCSVALAQRSLFTSSNLR